MAETGYALEPGGPGDIPALGGMDRWPTNAAMMIDVAALGYLGDLGERQPVFDATYGLGNFWTLVRPTVLITNDLAPDKPSDFDWDYRTVPGPGWSGAFAAVVFDPPYKLNGTAGEQEHRSYGVGDGATNGERIDSASIGAIHCAQMVQVGGFLLTKTQPNVAGGRVRWQPRTMAAAVESVLGFAQVDEFVFQNRPRPQPPGRRQLTARRNYSVLSVFKRDR